MLKFYTFIFFILQGALTIKNNLPPLCFIDCEHGLVYYGSSFKCNKTCAVADKPLVYNFSSHYDENSIVTKDDKKEFTVTLPWSFMKNKLNSSVNHSVASVNELSIGAYSDSTELSTSTNRYGDLTAESDGTIIMNSFTVIAVNDIMRRYLTKTLPSSGSMSLGSLASSSNLKVFKFKLHSEFDNFTDDLKTNYFFKLISLEGRYRIYYSLLINSEHSVEYDFTIETDVNCGISATGAGAVSADVDAGSFEKYTTTTRLPSNFKINDRTFSKRQLCRSTPGCKNWVSMQAGSTFCVIMRNTRYFRDSEAYLVMQFVPEFDIETKDVKEIYNEVSSWFPWRIFFIVVGVLILLIVLMSVAMK
eukprot:GAHX01000321.1.p1 GENE.GAHX01000321.1~~GAHX01000321.1.p1  ORF type:complete len:361 (+),score=60.98 GAHX01000321.1:34-1116(+)